MNDVPNIQLPAAILSRAVTYTDTGRLMGWHIMGGPGGGKSRLMGRLLVPQDIYRGLPCVVIDPNGATIANVIDKLARQPLKEQQYYFPRVWYIDMAGVGGRVASWPLIYPTYPKEPHFKRSRRFVEAIRRLDPALTSAPILGFNPLKSVATYAGIVLSALGLQFSEAVDLLDNPEGWLSRLNKARDIAHAEMEQPYRFFAETYPALRQADREKVTSSLRAKLEDLFIDPETRAIFGANVPSINWQEVVEQRLCILLDFSKEHEPQLLRFKMLWVLSSFLAFIHRRGAGHRHQPVSLVIDELANMYSAGGGDLFADDLDRLINVTARNYGVYVTLAHQELYQFQDERIRRTLMSMGTQIIGNTQDPDAAYQMARQFIEYDPERYKRYEPVYGSSSFMGETDYYVIDERPVDTPIQEQFLLESYQFLKRKPFHFLVKTVEREGQRSAPIQYMSIESLDRGVWVDEEKVEWAKPILFERCSAPVAEILSDISGRLRVPSYHQPNARQDYTEPLTTSEETEMHTVENIQDAINYDEL